MITTRLNTPATPGCSHEQNPARMVAGALAHLATHMSTGCSRAGYLAAMLLDTLANDADADAQLRRHARELVDILDTTRLPASNRHPDFGAASTRASVAT